MIEQPNQMQLLNLFEGDVELEELSQFNDLTDLVEMDDEALELYYDQLMELGFFDKIGSAFKKAGETIKNGVTTAVDKTKQGVTTAVQKTKTGVNKAVSETKKFVPKAIKTT